MTVPVALPLGVYFDTCSLFDIEDTSRPRHNSALSFLNLCKRNKAKVDLMTSMFATNELVQKLYEQEATKHIPHPSRNDLHDAHNKVPPDIAALQRANSRVKTVLERFELDFGPHFSYLPSERMDGSTILQLSHDIGITTAIWPNDSIHLACALESGASLLISDDRDLLLKTHGMLYGYIRAFRAKRFSMLGSQLQAFSCHGFGQHDYRTTGRPHVKLRAATAELQNRGFR